MSWVDTYVSWCFFIAMAAPVVFVVVYSTMQWKKSWEGRVLMFKQALWVGFLLNGVLYYALGDDYFGRDALRILLFTALPIALWSLTILLIVRRHQARAAQTLAPEIHPPVEDHQLG
jgi:FtsH-binding integral membrane protein